MDFELNFNSYRDPVLRLTMKDPDATQILVTTPNVGLTEKLRANLPELQTALVGKDAAASRAIYQLAADLINCNASGITVTAYDLAGKYGLDLEFDMPAFYEQYIGFITAIKNAKN